MVAVSPQNPYSSVSPFFSNIEASWPLTEGTSIKQEGSRYSYGGEELSGQVPHQPYSPANSCYLAIGNFAFPPEGVHFPFPFPNFTSHFTDATL